jgi:carboxypeptidase D
MQLLSLLAVGGLTASVSARSARSVGKKNELPRPRLTVPESSLHPHKRQSTQIITTEASKSFAVNGTAGAIPDVDFDIGESYAGLLPISKAANETSELYFWFFPSENPDASDEITIWLNGGPGCSSLEGFLQENGPISWQYGSGPAAVYNPWNWVR